MKKSPRVEDMPMDELITEVLSRIDNTNGLEFVEVGVLRLLRNELSAFVREQEGNQ